MWDGRVSADRVEGGREASGGGEKRLMVAVGDDGEVGRRGMDE